MLDVQWEETLQIGSDAPNASDHELFSMITGVVEHEGRLFISDGQERAVRVYDGDGGFVRTIGREGGGPGEFESIGALHVDARGRLLVADPSQMRISAFSLNGELRSTYQLPQIHGVDQIAELPDGRFVLVGFSEEHLVHIVDSSFSEVEYSLVRSEEVLYTGETLEEIGLQFSPGRVLPLADDVILYAPYIYAGKLYRYELESDGSWHRTDKIEGQSHPADPVTFARFEEADRVDAPLQLDGERYAAQFHASSQGLFREKDDAFLHFSAQEAGDYIELVVERFTIGGSLQGRAVVDTTSVGHALHAQAFGRDHSLYLSDTRDIPKLRCLEMEINKIGRVR